MPRSLMTTQPKEKRIKNFNEVSLGFSKKVAMEEAKRCPQCTDPICSMNCPLGIKTPALLRYLREGNVNAAYEIVRENNCFPSICGRICNAPCETVCVLNAERAPLAIRGLERFAADFGRVKLNLKGLKTKNGRKVAVVGAGPAGLFAAFELIKRGYEVKIFEAMDKPGGVLRYGVPEFRVPKKILDSEINDLKALGLTIEHNFFIGQTKSITELFKDDFSAILLATGAGIPKFMNIPGANLARVYYGEEFLMRVNLTKTNIFARQIPTFEIGQKIAVIGSGNTALDCARAAVRFGRDVTLIFRRTEDEMRVKVAERTYGKEEGIHFEPLTRPIEIIKGKNNSVAGLKCLRMDYADNDSSGKWQLTEVPESEFIIDVDTVVIAVGHIPNSYIANTTPELKINQDKTIHVDENGMTSIEGVFAAGNVITNAGPFVQALAGGKKAAENIDKFLAKK